MINREEGESVLKVVKQGLSEEGLNCNKADKTELGPGGKFY